MIHFDVSVFCNIWVLSQDYYYYHNHYYFAYGYFVVAVPFLWECGLYAFLNYLDRIFHNESLLNYVKKVFCILTDFSVWYYSQLLRSMCWGEVLNYHFKFINFSLYLFQFLHHIVWLHIHWGSLFCPILKPFAIL